MNVFLCHAWKKKSIHLASVFPFAFGLRLFLWAFPVTSSVFLPSFFNSLRPYLHLFQVCLFGFALFVCWVVDDVRAQSGKRREGGGKKDEEWWWGWGRRRVGKRQTPKEKEAWLIPRLSRFPAKVIENILIFHSSTPFFHSFTPLHYSLPAVLDTITPAFIHSLVQPDFVFSQVTWQRLILPYEYYGGPPLEVLQVSTTWSVLPTA